MFPTCRQMPPPLGKLSRSTSLVQNPSPALAIADGKIGIIRMSVARGGRRLSIYMAPQQSLWMNSCRHSLIRSENRMPS